MIDCSEAPYMIKLHIKTAYPHELTDIDIHQSILSYVQSQGGYLYNSNNINIQVQQYPQKCQIKVFIKVLTDKQLAKDMFKDFYLSWNIPFYS